MRAHVNCHSGRIWNDLGEESLCILWEVVEITLIDVLRAVLIVCVCWGGSMIFVMHVDGYVLCVCRVCNIFVYVYVCIMCSV